MRDFIDRNAMTITLTIFGIMLASIFIFSSYTSPVNGEEVDCYDKFSNKIEGQSCITEGGFDSQITYIISAYILGIMMVVGGYMFGSIMDSLTKPFVFGGLNE